MMKVGSTAYSYRKYLTSGEMTLEGFLDKAVELRMDIVDLTSYYFKSTDIEYLNYIKKCAYLRGLDITGTAVGNSFTYKEAEKRADAVNLVKKWVDFSVILGAPCIRVFAGGVPEGSSFEEAKGWTVQCLEECLDYAKPKGVIIALENHGGITSTADQVISILEAVSGSYLEERWLGTNLDLGNYRGDPYGNIEKAAPYAVTTHAKTDVFVEGVGRQDADFEKITQILHKAGYKGCLSIEYEGAEEPMTAMPKFVNYLKACVSKL
ncbi:MAG: Sugar phosphate isomerase/epimerase [Euryarchaeota archaeon]|nr:Sugar phosphate isomerase/epimerase [Euryarchaeota archaeon]